MSEESKTKTVTSPTPEEVKGQAPAGAMAQAGAGAELTVQDLTVIRSIIDVASQRGAFKANEMAAVGNVYNILMNFLIANGAVKPAEEQTAEEKTQETPEVAEKQEEVSND